MKQHRIPASAPSIRVLTKHKEQNNNSLRVLVLHHFWIVHSKKAGRAFKEGDTPLDKGVETAAGEERG
jgi:hypothetical protein